MISPSLESIPAKEDKVISFCKPFSVTTELSESTNWEFSLSISTECSGSNSECFSFSVSTEVSVLTHSELSPFSVSTAILVSANSFSVTTEAVDEMTLSFLPSYRYASPWNVREKQPWKFRKVSLQKSSSISQNVTLVLRKNSTRILCIQRKTRQRAVDSRPHVRRWCVDGVPASTSTIRPSKTEQVQQGLYSKYIHSALAAQNCTAQKHNSACRQRQL